MTTQTNEKMMNGVPVGQLTETMRAIRTQPEIAKFAFRAENAWQGGGHNVAEIGDYDGACQHFERETAHRIEMDEPPVLLSQDRGAGPVEVLLAALSGCLTTSLVYHAAAMGIEVTAVESSYEGDIDLHGFLGMNPEIRNGCDTIRVSFRVTAPGATEEELDGLVRVARERSPVFDMVSNGTTVEVTRSR